MYLELDLGMDKDMLKDSLLGILVKMQYKNK